MKNAVLTVSLPGFQSKSGKVREVFDLGDKLLIVATDRISAFDVVMPNGIPDKGKILTSMSLFWFKMFQDEFQNHLISANVENFPAKLQPYNAQLAGRSMLVKKAKVIPVECIARGYLAGSGWKEYQKSQTVCGIKLPAGLKQCDKLPEPIFTPSTKAEVGHDENITFAQMKKLLGDVSLATLLQERTLDLYTRAADYARSRGIIIADTKFEFGILPDGSVILIDEVLTPDSSRFWPAEDYRPGCDQPSFDKQFVRNHLERIKWDKKPPAPDLPKTVVTGTQSRYLEAYRLLTDINVEL